MLLAPIIASSYPLKINLFYHWFSFSLLWSLLSHFPSTSKPPPQKCLYLSKVHLWIFYWNIAIRASIHVSDARVGIDCIADRLLHIFTNFADKYIAHHHYAPYIFQGFQALPASCCLLRIHSTALSIIEYIISIVSNITKQRFKNKHYQIYHFFKNTHSWSSAFGYSACSWI